MHVLGCCQLRQQLAVLPHHNMQEVMSYIKGSAEAVASPSGVLSEDEYLALGRKRAAGNLELRKQVYALLPVSAQQHNRICCVALHFMLS
jgi:hypothetical protein